MSATLGYDVYGTLIETDAVVPTLEPYLGDRAVAFSALWRQKQLEYAFRRGLMQRYRDFGVCTREALVYAARVFGLELTESDQEALMGAYRRLPPYPDVREGLERARDAGMHLYAFSNGTRAAVEEVLGNAGVLDYFRNVLSVDALGTYKPSPAVYAAFLRATGAGASHAWLVSANSFDVLGAVSAGLHAAWIRRSAEAVADPWELQPTLMASSLLELPERIQGWRSDSR